MSIKQTIKTFAMTTFGLAAIVATISTATPVSAGTCAGVNTAIINCTQKNGGDVKDSGVWAILILAINIMTAGVGILAVGAIAYGAILYSTSEGSADQTKKAITIITNVVIGLLCFLLMSAFLNFLIPGGAFN